MAKNCKYKYLDKDGNPSEFYAINKAKYGEEYANTLFISDALKTNNSIRFSSIIDNDEKLRTKFKYSDLSQQGYKGVTSVIKSTDQDDKIIKNLALNIKIRSELIKETSAAKRNIDDFVYINSHIKYNEVSDRVRKKYLDPDTQEITKNAEDAQEFENLKIDAKALLETQRTKGNLQHLLLEQVFIAQKEAKKNNSDNFNEYFDKAVDKYLVEINKRRDDFPNGNTLNKEVINNLRSIAMNLVKQADKLNSTYEVNDFEFLPEVSIFTDKIKYGNNPLQGHIDLLIYSPSTKLGYIIDYKTKSEQSFANYENFFGRMNAPFDDLPKSAENLTAIQTNAYELILNKEYGINVIGNDVLLITSKYSDGDLTEKVSGTRKWTISQIDHSSTKQEKLRNVKGLLSEILNIQTPILLGNKNSDTLISELFDNKLVTTIDSKDHFINSQEAKIKFKNDRYEWYNTYDPHNSINKSTKEEVLNGIGEVYEEFMEIKRRGATDLVDIFNGKNLDKSIWNSKKYKNKSIELLREFDTKTHILESHVEIPGIGKDIIVATNKFTGEVTIMSISTIYNAAYSFNETTDENAKTSIYGTLIDDETVAKKYYGTIIPKANTHSLTHLRLALLAAELKVRDPKKYENIGNLLSTTLSNDDPYSYSEVTTQMGYLKEMVKLMKLNKTPIPTELNIITENPDLSGKDAYKINYFEIFAKKFAQGMDPLRQMMLNKENINFSDAKRVREELKKALDQYQENKFNFEIYNKIEKTLESYIETVFGALLTKDKSIDNVYKNAEFASVNRAWLDFKGWMVTENPTFRSHVLGSLNSLTTIGEANAENAHLAISEYEQKARDEITALMTEHQKLQKDLIKSSTDITLIDEILKPDAFKKLFAPMMVDGYNFDEKNVDNWMKFKDPDDPKSNLSDQQKAYIRFYAKIVKQSSKTLFAGNFKTMYPDSESELFKIKKWDNYSIPIMGSAAKLDLKEVALSSRGMESAAEAIAKILKHSGKQTTEKSQNIMTPWEFTTMFPEQVDSAPGKGSSKSRYLLNISDDNSVISNKRNIELNPVTILNMMMVESARKEHMKVAAFATFSINAELAYKELYPGVDTKALRELISNVATMRVHGKVNDDGNFGKFLDTVKNVSALGLFWFSGSQVVTESGTALTQITSQSISNIINKYLFKGNNKYNNTDMLWATKHLGSALGSQIINDLGMHNTSLGQFTDSQYEEVGKKLAWQTKHGFWFIRNTLRQGVQGIVFAQMHKEGITEKCFKLDEVTGKYYYDETKDNRFYVYDKNNPILNQQSSMPTSETDIAKYNFWKTHREILMKEGGINKDGTMKRPFINKQLQSMKNYSIRLLGAMDNSEVMALEIGAVGRAMTTFQRWMRQKITNYTGTSKNKTFREGRWGLDENGKDTWIEEEFEGMFQAIVGITKDLMSGRSMADISNVRKRQSAKLLADALLGAIVMYLALALKDILKDSLIGKELLKGINNAASDVFPVAALANTLTGSPMPAMAITVNITQNVLRTTKYAITGDIENAITSGDKTLNTIGAYRAGKAFLDQIFDFETRQIKPRE